MKLLLRAVGLVVAIGALAPPGALADAFSFTTSTPDGRIGSRSTAGHGRRPRDRSGRRLHSRGRHAADRRQLLWTAASRRVSIRRRVRASRDLPRVPENSTAPAERCRADTRELAVGRRVRHSRGSGDGSLSYATSIVNPNFTVANSIVNGINPVPLQTTNGEGPVRGQEALIPLRSSFSLPPDYYFVVSASPADQRYVPLAVRSGTGALHGGFPGLDSQRQSGSNWLRAGTDIVEEA